MTSIPDTGLPEPSPDASSLDAGPARTLPWRSIAVGAVAVAAAIGAAMADSAPTGHDTVDLVERVLAAAAVTIAGASARRPNLIAFVTLPTMLAAPPWLFVGLVAMGIVVAEIVFRDESEPIIGALAAGLGAQVALRLGDVGFTGLTALVGIGAGALLIISAVREQSGRVRRIIWWTCGVVTGLATILAGFALLGALRAAPEIDDAIAVSNHGLRLAREGDIDRARPVLEEAGDSLGRAGADLEGWWSGPASLIPVVAQHQRAAVELTNAGTELSRLAGDVTSLVDSDALRGEDGRIDLDQIRALEEPTRRAQESVDRTLELASSVRSPWLVGTVDDRIEDLEQRLEDIAPSTSLAAEVVALLPDLLGGDGPRNYFLMLLTPSEARELGGISGSWADIRVDDGEIELADRGRSEDIDQYDVRLDESYPTSYRESLPGPNPQNYASTPDMGVATRGAAELYETATGTEVHGVIAVDIDALVGVIKLTGPLTVPGYPLVLTPENARQFLLYDQYQVIPDRNERGNYLNALIEEAFTQLTEGSLPDPRDVLSVFGPLVEKDRIRMLTFDDAEIDLFDELGLDGRLDVPEGADVLGVFHSNRGQNKLDAYLERDLDYTVEVDESDGTVTGNLTITFTSTAPTEGLPDIGNRNEGHPDGTNSTTLFVLTPLEMERAQVDGEDRNWVVQTEGTLNRRGLPIDIPPGATMTVELTLSGPLDLEEGYRLMVLHQPLVIDDELTVTVSDTDGVPWTPVEDGESWYASDRPSPVERSSEALFVPDR